MEGQELKALQGLPLTLVETQGAGRHAIAFFSSPAPALENQLTQKETMEQGSMRWRVYHHYIQAAGGMVGRLPPARPGLPSGGSPCSWVRPDHVRSRELERHRGVMLDMG